MKCELCEKEITTLQLVVPLAYGEFNTMGRGIHLDCIKEMLEVLRAATLAMAPSTEHQAPTGE